jgi:hypothetical protein
MRKFIKFFFFGPFLPRIKNANLRHTAYAAVMMLHIYRGYKAYEEAKYRTQTNTHLSHVDWAIDNDRISYGVADIAWLGENGIEV